MAVESSFVWYDVDWIGNYFVHRPPVNDVLILFLWHQWNYWQLATDVHQRSVLDVVVSSFLWQDLNWQICHRAAYWTLWHPLSYGKIWIGKFVIDSTFVTLQFSSFPSFLKFHSHTFIHNFLSQDRHLNSSYVLELQEDKRWKISNQFSFENDWLEFADWVSP